MDSDKIVIINEDGQEIEMDVLFTFESDVTNKQYVLYYDANDSEGGNVFVSSYTEDGDLQPVEDESEWEMINEVFNTFVESNDVSDDEHEHNHEHSCGCGCGHHHDH